MDWQIGWVGKGAGILIVGLVLWVQYPVEAIFLLILKPRDVNFVQEYARSGNYSSIVTKSKNHQESYQTGTMYITSGGNKKYISINTSG